ncbi:hypothetical protein OE810_01650 [Rhodobacteraceae bacterium XHP0102]|nr:hypothetical protein [Rhodobacteraceae bacterium XHP0102]
MMCVIRISFNILIAVFLANTAVSAVAHAQTVPPIQQDDARSEAQLNALLEELKAPVLPDWQRVEAEILNLWSRSGSPAMDLLLRRGRQAMARDDYQAALAHLTALTDHAPEFAEGWNARATLFFEMGDYGPSLDDIARTLALNPNHFGALTGLGMIMEEVKAYSHALDAFRAARAIHPHRPDLEQAVERLERQLEGISL